MDKSELETMISRPDISQWLTRLGLERHEVMGLFHVLDDAEGQGCVPHKELVIGIIRLSGGVRAMDSVMIMHGLQTIAQKIE